MKRPNQAYLDTLTEGTRQYIGDLEGKIERLHSSIGCEKRMRKDAEERAEDVQAQLETLHDNMLGLLPNAAHLRGLADEIEAGWCVIRTNPPILRVWGDYIDKLHAMIPAAALDRFHGKPAQATEETENTDAND